jgi:hypothetical protein
MWFPPVERRVIEEVEELRLEGRCYGVFGSHMEVAFLATLNCVLLSPGRRTVLRPVLPNAPSAGNAKLDVEK